MKIILRGQRTLWAFYLAVLIVSLACGAGAQTAKKPAASKPAARVARGDSPPTAKIAAKPAPPADPPTWRAAEAARRWAVIVGIDGYDSEHNRLHCAVKDARKFRELLDLPADHVAFLAANRDGTIEGERPTKANILTAIKTMTQKTGPRDTLILFFSGHGLELGGASHLVPVDLSSTDRVDTWETKTISVRDVRQNLLAPGACKAKTRLLILDACHSGSARSFDKLDSLTLFGGLNGTVTIAAADVTRKAIEFKAMGHGVFTYYLLRGLSGDAAPPGKAFVTLADLRAYVVKKVNAECVAHIEEPQEPQFLIPKEQETAIVAAKDPSFRFLMPPLAEGETLEVTATLRPGVAIVFDDESRSDLISNILKQKLEEAGYPVVEKNAVSANRAWLLSDSSAQQTAATGKVYARILVRGKNHITAQLPPNDNYWQASGYATLDLVLPAENRSESLNSMQDDQDVVKVGRSEQAAIANVQKRIAEILAEKFVAKVEKLLKQR